LGGALRRLPLVAEFAIKAFAMTAVLTIVAVSLEFALYPTPPGRQWFADELPRIVGISFAVSLLVGAIFEFRRLVGGRVLGSFLLGTYHRPKREQRIIMFLDIQSSTALAEAMGELRVHDLITKFFYDIDQPIAEHGGEVHAYVGDAVIVTWPLSEDPERNARPLRCFFEIQDKMAELNPVYEREFSGAAVSCRCSRRAGRRQRVWRYEAADCVFWRHDECCRPAVRSLQDRRRSAVGLGGSVALCCGPAGVVCRNAREHRIARAGGTDRDLRGALRPAGCDGAIGR
jgi:hypothetical protein